MRAATDQQTGDTGAAGLLPALGWACYLGCSWTWVIGMLLPGLLLRDYGVWGYVAFAVPNVVGAAAMGWALKDAGAARRVVAGHRPMLDVFSDVTIAYHVFVVAWLLPLFGVGWLPWLVPVLAVVFALLRPARWVTLVAMVVAFVSWVLFAQTASGMASTELVLTPWGQPGERDALALLLFVPASVLGFACCPYLDLTFLRARWETSVADGRVAFGVGFGVVFFSMIVFAALYGRQVLWGGAGGSGVPWGRVIPAFLVLQIAFTLAVHTQERVRNNRPLGMVGLVAAVALGVVLAVFQGTQAWGGESIYRGFLLMYGTVFPLYVVLCMLPRLSRTPTCPRRRFAVFVVASVAAYPLGWIGYVDFQWWGAVGAMAVVAAAWGVVQVLPATACRVPSGD